MVGEDWLQASFSAVRPKALAALNRIFRDLDLAEEALAIACEKAVVAWAEAGEPRDPLAWLLTTARNAGLDIVRKERRRERLTPYVSTGTEVDDAADRQAGFIDDGNLGDDVLRLFFICCHPALSPQDQAALALRVIGGLSVAEIAKAFVVRPAAMEKRLVRARAQVGTARLPFETPTPVERRERLRAVSLMIYLMFNEGWSATSGPQQIKSELCEEAIRLARLLLQLFPAVVELQGLLALFLFHYSRRDGRVAPDGRLLPLDEQDRSRRDEAMIAEASTLLQKALRHGEPDRFQVEAAIAAAHATAVSADDTDWREIERLYRLLAVLDPTPIVWLNHAGALARTEGPERALEALAPLAQALDHYRWFHSARAGLLFDLGRFAEAGAAYRRALALTPTDAERDVLLDKIARCKKS